MIDTVGKYLGKTEIESDSLTPEDIAEGMGDPNKYNNLFQFFSNMQDSYESDMQVVLVDNDVPKTVEKSLKQFVVKHFRVDGKYGAQIGLIDDVNQQ